MAAEVFPQSLVDIFIKIHENDWQDEKLYQEWIEIATKYLGKPKNTKGELQYSEGHMRCILITKMASALVLGEIKATI